MANCGGGDGSSSAGFPGKIRKCTAHNIETNSSNIQQQQQFQERDSFRDLAIDNE